jgi:hypothetical protein
MPLGRMKSCGERVGTLYKFSLLAKNEFHTPLTYRYTETTPNGYVTRYTATRVKLIFNLK